MKLKDESKRPIKAEFYPEGMERQAGGRRWP